MITPVFPTLTEFNGSQWASNSTGRKSLLHARPGTDRRKQARLRSMSRAVSSGGTGRSHIMDSNSQHCCVSDVTTCWTLTADTDGKRRDVDGEGFFHLFPPFDLWAIKRTACFPSSKFSELPLSNWTPSMPLTTLDTTPWCLPKEIHISTFRQSAKNNNI